MVIQSLSANPPFSFPPAPSPEAIKRGLRSDSRRSVSSSVPKPVPSGFPSITSSASSFEASMNAAHSPAEVEPEELHERRAVVEPRFTQNPPEGGMGNTFQDGLTQLFFRPDGLCRCRVGMTVRIDTTVRPAISVKVWRMICPHDLPTSKEVALPIIQSYNASCILVAKSASSRPLSGMAGVPVRRGMVMTTLFASRMRSNCPSASSVSRNERTVARCQCHSDARSETVTWHWQGERS